MADDTDLTEEELVELSFLRDLETDKLIEAGLLSDDLRLSSPLDNELFLKYGEMDLVVTAGSAYPVYPTAFRVDNHSLPREVVDNLRIRLREIVASSETTNNMEKWRQREDDNAFGIYEPAMVVLELGQEAQKHLDAYRRTLLDKMPKIDHGLPFEMKQPTATFSTSGVALRYLRKTPEQICQLIPSQFRVLHIEEVVRSDLARAFDYRQAQLRRELSHCSFGNLQHFVPPQMRRNGRKEDLVEYLVRPHLTWHGTQRQYVPSIVRHGFILPGSKKPGDDGVHEVRCGSTYGRGIYSSPSAEFSLSYSDWGCEATKPNQFFGLKLFVCATIMGRTRLMLREDDWRLQQEAYPGADSHVANRELEYIVFDKAQIIPVYVVHLDWGQNNAMHFLNIPTDPSHWVPITRKAPANPVAAFEYAGDAQRMKQAVFARASKWFPYGYGPATGGRFVVEEVGEVSEDEEEYGEYQALRVEETKDKQNLDFWSWVKVGQEEDLMNDGLGRNENDEYSNERRGYAPAGIDWDLIPVPESLREPESEKDGEGEDEDIGFLLETLFV